MARCGTCGRPTVVAVKDNGEVITIDPTFTLDGERYNVESERGGSRRAERIPDGRSAYGQPPHEAVCGKPR